MVLVAVPECLTCSHHRSGTKYGVKPDIAELQEPSELVQFEPHLVYWKYNWKLRFFGTWQGIGIQTGKVLIPWALGMRLNFRRFLEQFRNGGPVLTIHSENVIGRTGLRFIISRHKVGWDGFYCRTSQMWWVRQESAPRIG
jgi:hypothetical protein